MNTIEAAACDAALARVESGWKRGAAFSLAAYPDAAETLANALGRAALPEESAKFEAEVRDNLAWAFS